VCITIIIICSFDMLYTRAFKLYDYNWSSIFSNAILIIYSYRLAPEHLFPAAFEDCLAATKYFIKNAAQFNVDPNRIALGGNVSDLSDSS